MPFEDVYKEVDRSKSPMPFLEWRFGEEVILSHIEELAQIERPTLVLAECAYQMGYFREAVETARAVAQSGTSAEKMVARCIEMCGCMAIADAAGAQRALELARAACREGFTHEDDDIIYNASIICARILEDTVCATLANRSLEFDSLHEVPRGFQAFCGFLMAYRTMVEGEYAQAIGMARGFMAIAGKKYPLSAVKLKLVMAASYLRLRKPNEASQMYQEAWDIANPLGIVGPFIEMSAWLPGLTRHCLYEQDRKSFQAIRSMMGTQRTGWHELRRRLRQPVPGVELSALEYSTATLAVWQWSNREIASFLGIAENTVKHYLSSAYQKMGVRGRGELLNLVPQEFRAARAAV